MKKGYIWLAPLAALALFIGLYVQSRGAYEANEKRKAEEARIEKQRRNEETAKRNAEIAEQRRKETEKKKEEEAAEKARIEADKKHLEEIDYARDFAKREAARYENVVKDLTESFKTEKESQKAADKAIADMREEKKFITEYVAKAQANEKALKDLLQKLEKLEKDRLAAAAAAAKS
ncbi:MAG TPA: hypothetical protein VK163_13350 [Opitutaceae bacterium]|nr:hypothetical protein [Opitutaceae bacterium]